MTMAGRFLILGASSLFGQRAWERLGPARAVATYCRHPVPGGVRFDALSDDIGPLLAREPDIRHALVMFAEAGIDACAREPARAHALNVDATVAVLERLIAAGVTPVFVSTDTVFDGTRGGYVESDPAAPILTYGRLKLAVERHLAAQGGPHVVVRVAKLVDRRPGRKSFFGDWIGAIRAGRPVRCAIDQTLSPIDLDDAVDALVRLAESGCEGVFHVGGPGAWNRVDLFEVLERELRRVDPAVEGMCETCSIRDFAGFAEPRPLDTSLNSGKLIGATGFRPRDIGETCRAIVRAVYSK